MTLSILWCGRVLLHDVGKMELKRGVRLCRTPCVSRREDVVARWLDYSELCYRRMLDGTLWRRKSSFECARNRVSQHQQEHRQNTCDVKLANIKIGPTMTNPCLVVS